MQVFREVMQVFREVIQVFRECARQVINRLVLHKNTVLKYKYKNYFLQNFYYKFGTDA